MSSNICSRLHLKGLEIALFDYTTKSTFTTKPYNFLGDDPQDIGDKNTARKKKRSSKRNAITTTI